MINILNFLFLLVLLLCTLTMILFLISHKSIIDREKSSPFECGFDPFESSRIPFSSHFFMIAVIFLVFDVELVIIMPVIISISNMNIVYLYMIMFSFMFILIFGLFHEWYNKMFDWLWGCI